MKDMMKYKNYYGSVHYSDEDKLFYGKVEFIRALVSYEGTDVTSLRKSFEEAVDDYGGVGRNDCGGLGWPGFRAEGG